MGVIAGIIAAIKHGSTLITGVFIGYEIAASGKPEESIENSNVGSENRHNYDSYFNVTFENGTTGIILIAVVIVVIVIVGFFFTAASAVHREGEREMKIQMKMKDNCSS